MQRDISIHPAPAPLQGQWLLLLCIVAGVMFLPVRPTTAAAPGMVTLSDIQRGELLFRTDEAGAYVPAPSLNTDVEITVSGIVANTAVRHHFHNPSDAWVEGIYVFPLPEDAAVHGLRMKIGDRYIEGEIQEKQAARETYEAAKQAGKRASLLEQHRPNIFKAAVANIGPEEDIVIELSYQQVLKPDNGRFSLHFPMTVGPRYRSPGTAATSVNTSPAPEQMPPHVLPAETASLNLTEINLTLNTGLPAREISSLNHAIRKEKRPEEGTVTISLAEGPVPAEQDFVLQWRLAQSDTVNTALLREQREDGDYLLVMTVPPKPATAASGNQTYRRDLVFILDRSGSMAGDSFPQAKAGLVYGLGQLRPGDSFNIVAFNHTTDALFPASQPVSEGTLQLALDWIESLVADGGTEMQPALQTALSSAGPAEHLRQVIFLTDGAIGDETRMFGTIHRTLGTARLFPVGIGSAPNRHLLAGAGRMGRGHTTMIGDLTHVEAEMKGLFTLIERPMLTDISATYTAADGSVLRGDAVEQSPSPIPDLFAGEPVFFTVKLPKDVSTVTLRGNRNGTSWTEILAVNEAENGVGIGRLWARKAIEELEFGRLLAPDTEEAHDRTILHHALQYGLVSRLTSLVAVDVTPARPTGQSLQTRDVPTRLPKGWLWEKFTPRSDAPLQKASLQQWNARFASAPLLRQPAPSAAAPVAADMQEVRLPGTATAAPLARLAGFALVLLALTLWWWRRASPARQS